MERCEIRPLVFFFFSKAWHGLLDRGWQSHRQVVSSRARFLYLQDEM